ncbi:WbqC family protein [Pseudotenacibaculum sp. MALMAid0570]|uniref:WbqC family protein n=1 Tax=Pseudotenacibaculum sp. MALMAid0570 TaxID=3143938 RepID=UPI0032DF3EA5
MIVSAHQPHFLPWLGYFNKVAKSDVFVWLENVQFRKNYFQNRTKIKVGEDEFWLTVPVKKASLETHIADIEVVKSKDYRKITKTIASTYSKTPHYIEFFADIENIINSDETSLNELNYNLFTYLLNTLDIDTQIIRSSELDLQSDDPNIRLVELCAKLKGTDYIAGKGGLNYMDESLFQEKSINILWQKFPVQDIQYQQRGENFIMGLSILDALFNIGADKTRELIFTEWKN